MTNCLIKGWRGIQCIVTDISMDLSLSKSKSFIQCWDKSLFESHFKKRKTCTVTRQRRDRKRKETTVNTNVDISFVMTFVFVATNTRVINTTLVLLIIIESFIRYISLSHHVMLAPYKHHSVVNTIYMTSRSYLLLS